MISFDTLLDIGIVITSLMVAVIVSIYLKFVIGIINIKLKEMMSND